MECAGSDCFLAVAAVARFCLLECAGTDCFLAVAAVARFCPLECAASEKQPCYPHLLTPLIVRRTINGVNGSVVEWRRLFNGCRAFHRARMLTLNIDLFNLKIFAILGLIISTTIAIIKNAKTVHFSFQTWTWPFRASFHDPF